MADATIHGIEVEVEANAGGAVSAINKLANTLSRFKAAAANIRQVSSELKNLRSSATKSASAISNFAKSFKDTKAGKGLLTFSKALTDTIKAVGKFGLKGLGAGMKGLGSLASLPFKKAIPDITNFTSKIGGVLSGFKRILGYRIIRRIIREISEAFQEGTKNLYEWSRAVGGAMIKGKTFAQTMDGIASSSAYFKNSIGAAVAPLISALAPAIDFVIDKVVALINVINQLLALLGGATSWNKAIRNATEYGDAVGGAGGAAKEALKYLAPFDELNVLPDDKSGGGGGGGVDYSNMFEEQTEFANGLKDFADNIKAAVEAGDWEGLGTLLGGKINEIVEMIDFAGAGQKIGSFINAWFSTKYWTLDSINFTNIGAKIADFLNNALGEIDFEIIGRSLVQKFEVFADTLIGFIENADWGEIASSIGDTLSGFFKEIGDWFTETDFAALADSIWNGVKDAVSSVDWTEVAQSIFRALGAAIGAAASFLAQLGKDIITDIWNAIKAEADSNGDGELTGKEIILGIWEGIKKVVSNAAQWIKDNIFTPFLDGIKNAFGIHSPASTMIPIGQNIAEGILSGIAAIWSNIKAWVNTNVWQPLVNAWNDLVGDGSPFHIDAEAEVNEITLGSDTHFSSSGSEFGGSHGSFTVEDGALVVPMNGAITKIQDKINASEKVISGIEAGLTKAQDSIPQAQKTVYTQARFNSVSSALTDSQKTVYTQARFNSVSSALTDSQRTVYTTSRFNAVSSALTASQKTIPTTSRFSSVSSALTDSQKTIYTQSRFNSVSSALTDSQKTIYTQSRFNSVSSALTDKQKTIGTSANFISSANGLKAEDTTFGSTALFNKYSVSKNVADGVNMQINATANITKTKGNVKGNLTISAQALGGVLQNGVWSSIPQYASGTTRAHGSLFVAGEAGPEVVGHIGGRTEVLNRSQLAATMYASVRNAMRGIGFHMSTPSYSSESESDNEEMMYRAFSRALADSGLDGGIELDGEVLYRKMVSRNKQNTRLTGVNAMAV